MNKFTQFKMSTYIVLDKSLKDFLKYTNVQDAINKIIENQSDPKLIELIKNQIQKRHKNEMYIRYLSFEDTSTGVLAVVSGYAPYHKYRGGY